MATSMELQKETDIQNCFKNSTILLTGSTGFIGSVILEKTLRSLNVKTVFCLIRTDQTQSLQDRLDTLLKKPIFEKIPQKELKKIKPINGDLNEGNLGLSEENLRLLEDLDFVIHCAGSTRINEPLSDVAKLNIKGTNDLLNIAKKNAHLKAFVYVSSAYSNYNKDFIDEEVGDYKIDPLDLLKSIEKDGEKAPLSQFIGDLPNTYCFSKQVTEALLKKNSQSLPICIVRPSFVTSSYGEPITAYIENSNGITGVIISIILGIMHVFYSENNVKIDLMPVDFTVNNILAAAWKTSQNPNSKSINVYNAVNAGQNPLRIGDFLQRVQKFDPILASKNMFWQPFCYVTNNPQYYTLLNFIFHKIPLLIAHVGFMFCSKKKCSGKTCNKENCQLDGLKFITSKTFTFGKKNNLALWHSLSIADKTMFNFDIKSLDWDEYLVHYLKGIKLFIFKENFTRESLDEVDKQVSKVSRRHFMAKLLLVLFVLLPFFYFLF